MAGGGGDELAAFLRQDRRDPLRISCRERLAGEDNHAGIDLFGRQSRGDIGVVDDRAEARVVDAVLVLIGRERHLRLKQRPRAGATT